MFDIHQAPQDEEGEFDPDKIPDYVDGVMEEFVDSPEAKPVFDAGGDVDGAAYMMDYALNHLGKTPPKMTVRDFNEVVFEIIPRKLSTPAEEGPGLIAGIRAFWQFAQRHYGLENAAAILASVGEDAGERLRAKLADPGNFGMAKSFVMAGKEAGYEMTNEASIKQFMTLYNMTQLANSSRAPSAFPEDILYLGSIGSQHEGWGRKEKRKGRKRQRQAKKRNRR